MNLSEKLVCLLFLGLILFPGTSHSQTLHNVGVNYYPGLRVENIVLSDSSKIALPNVKPLYTFLLNNRIYSSDAILANFSLDEYLQNFENNLLVTFKISDHSGIGWEGELTFENNGTDTVSISNVVPFGEDINSVYITGKGPWDLARAWLFRPGFRPVRVILPDNAWELGYSSFVIGDGFSMCAIARRIKTDGGQKQRYQTILPPKSKVVYALYADIFSGEWQNGLRMMFRDRYLYDLKKFDNSLFERKDLAWIKASYIIILQMAWDREFYDRLTGRYNYGKFIEEGQNLLGNIDAFGIWPTWPRLGLDERNQWDLYRDLPGGIEQLRRFVLMSQQANTRFFIAYNPWDNSTREEDHYKGMSKLIKETGADGVVLDTRGSSSIELQAAADSVKEGVVMYSEGMAITKDMPGIIAGRVHNAIYLSPELNLNKLIKPDFSIFRVCDVGEDLIHREIAISFFNGYGTELNMFRPGGRDENYMNDLEYLSGTTFILRQNNDAFLDNNWTPLIETTIDDVYVNRWKSAGKTLFTVLNMRPKGVNETLFKVENKNGKHYVSLWNHENLATVIEKGESYITANAPGWQNSFSGTRREGSVDCIAEFPDLIKSDLAGDSVKIEGIGHGKLIIWKGNPSYNTFNKELRVFNDTTISVKDIFGYYEGKIVLQLIENKLLKDENILFKKGGKPWIISKVIPTKRSTGISADMVFVSGTHFLFNVTTNEDFMPYPDVNNIPVKVDSFLIDKYPVTNAQYFDFIQNSGYKPYDTIRYLRHWKSGMYARGQERNPVVYVSYEDMAAYAKWAEKRLPTQAEWQLAAQGPVIRKWPWGDEFHGAYCNNAFGRPTPVDAFPKGQSQYGVMDMVGNVWQMMNDMYFNGTDYFMVIRGGSYYKPESSWWYIQGGPQPLDKTQILLMVSPGFDRSSTVGFRCVKDIDSKNFKVKRLDSTSSQK
jgi:formylglycine-generating enzyme required for sulfatase activity